MRRSRCPKRSPFFVGPGKQNYMQEQDPLYCFSYCTVLYLHYQ